MSAWDAILATASPKLKPTEDESPAVEPLVATDVPVGDDLTPPLLAETPVALSTPELEREQAASGLTTIVVEQSPASTAEEVADLPSSDLYPSEPTRIRANRKPEVIIKKIRTKQRGPKPKPMTKSATAPPTHQEDAQLDENYLLPRETGEDVGMACPVPLTPDIAELITRMRLRKDEKENHARLRDIMFMKKAPHAVSSVFRSLLVG